jgi:type IV pilus assembly protein PilO
MAAAPASRLNSPVAKLAVGGLFALLLLVGFVLVFYTDMEDSITKEKSRTAQLNADLAQQKRAEETYFKDRDDLAVREQKQREYNRILPADAEPAAFLSAIQAVANIAGVNLKGWQPMEEVKETFFARVPMKLELEGKFHQIARFTYEIGKTDRIINVENLEVSDPKEVGEDLVLKAKCLATTFHTLKPAAAPAPAPGAAPAPAPAGTR